MGVLDSWVYIQYMFCVGFLTVQRGGFVLKHFCYFGRVCVDSVPLLCVGLGNCIENMQKKKRGWSCVYPQVLFFRICLLAVFVVHRALELQSIVDGPI